MKAPYRILDFRNRPPLPPYKAIFDLKFTLLDNPLKRELVGAGIGASHQTGWSGLVATLIDLFRNLDAVKILNVAKRQPLWAHPNCQNGRSQNEGDHGRPRETGTAREEDCVAF